MSNEEGAKVTTIRLDMRSMAQGISAKLKEMAPDEHTGFVLVTNVNGAVQGISNLDIEDAIELLDFLMTSCRERSVDINHNHNHTPDL
jgi:hypothetical protein